MKLVYNYNNTVSMKKFFLLSAVVLLLSSCSIVNRSQADSSKVFSPTVETATVATIKVYPEKITYRYVPDKRTARSLDFNQLVQNAIYAALQEYGNADELVQVSYSVATKRGFFTKRVRSITVSGYPAYYLDFREPTDKDLRNIEALSKSRMFRDSDLKVVELHEGESVE